MGDFFAFRRMVTPVVIQLLFWLGTLACVGVGVFLFGEDQPVQGILAIVVGPFLVRIYCEIMIVLFRINETLTDIRNNTAR